MQQEIWKDIPNYEGLYQVSNYGRIKSLARFNRNKRKQFLPEKILKPSQKNGYLFVNLYSENGRKNCLIHRIVAQTFIPNYENQRCINHKNEIRTDNRVENLEWCTYLYNNNYGERNVKISKTRCKSEKCKKDVENRKKSILQIDRKGNTIREFESIQQAKKAMGKKINNGSINAVLKGQRELAYGFKWEYKS